jgi:3-hydroxyacyl-CoA dehydrogenase
VDVTTMQKTAAMIGAGLIGRAWSMVFARAGWTVRLYDAFPAQLEPARRYIEAGLADQQASGLCDDATAAASRIAYVSSLEDAMNGAIWVQEQVLEKSDLKREIFARLDSLASPDAIIASSTSGFPASQFTESLAGRARCLVAHPVNPPHLVPLVELSGAPWTSRDTIERAHALMTEVGQVPVVVRREIDGFILNRLQGALLSEAMRLVGEGYVSADDLDKTVRDGLGLRWSFMGPFETIELNAPGGVADYCERYSGLYRRIAAEPARPDVWLGVAAQRVSTELGPPLTPSQRDIRTAWRDRRLLALRAHKRQQSELD